MKKLKIAKIVGASQEFLWSMGKISECSGSFNDNIRQHLEDMCQNHIDVLKECKLLLDGTNEVEDDSYNDLASSLNEIIDDLKQVKSLL